MSRAYKINRKHKKLINRLVATEKIAGAVTDLNIVEKALNPLWRRFRSESEFYANSGISEKLKAIRSKHTDYRLTTVNNQPHIGY